MILPLITALVGRNGLLLAIIAGVAAAIIYHKATVTVARHDGIKEGGAVVARQYERAILDAEKEGFARAADAEDAAAAVAVPDDRAALRRLCQRSAGCRSKGYDDDQSKP